MNRLVNQILKTALSELFVDALKDTVHLSLGDDLFSSSKIHLQNLTLRPDIFDACLHPFKLLSGHLGNLKIEGIAEVALGGSIKISIENVFLLFTISKPNDALHLQTLKKILLELISNGISHQMVKNLLRKLLGMAPDKSTDTIRQRKLIYAAMKHFFKILQITIKKIHLRIEFNPTAALSSIGQRQQPQGALESSFCAIGITLPSLKIAQNLVFTNTALRSEMNAGSEENDPQIALLLKSLQVCSLSVSLSLSLTLSVSLSLCLYLLTSHSLSLIP
jgi:hypothetical protein